MFLFVHKMCDISYTLCGSVRVTAGKKISSKGFPRREFNKGLCSELRAMLNEPIQRWHHDHAWLEGMWEESMPLEPRRAGLGRGWQGSSYGH